MKTTKPSMQVLRESWPEWSGTTEVRPVHVRDVVVGGDRPTIIAGPCAVESLEQTVEIALEVRDAGGNMLRGGAYKPRTSPYSFQGLGEAGLEILAEARERTGLPVVSEVMETRLVELVSQYVDVLQVGSRSMQNFPLLKAVGASGKPVLLKRGWSATLEEWLLAASTPATRWT
jgi:3-deoxy-7-phosphoheptulonate synthase